MPPTDIPDISAENLETLEHLASLLHLLHHRNKNQHRRSIWFRHFSLFRRSLSATLQDFFVLHSTPATHLQRTLKAATDAATKTRIAQRLTLWQDVLVPKWQRAFSQIVADGRFAVVGVVLLAVLSQVCVILEVVEGYEELGQEEVERVIEGFGREFLAERFEGGTSDGGEKDDLGVVVERDEGGSTLMEEVGVELVMPAADRTNEVGSVHDHGDAVSDKPPARRKKRKANAIDDLFGALD